ncbi:MAG: hypothetical protein PHN69_00115 [Candidatus Pacebacteria bacterium]|nr:hypothetical protein [Candidatus Paceibacterota bacterium]
MFKQKIFVISFIVLVLIAVFNYLGMKFNLYWFYRWYDIPMHMLGGFWVTLFSLSIYNHFSKIFPVISYYVKFLYVMLFILLAVAISWEVFELAGGITFVDDRGYWIDTFADILNAYIGGAVVYFLFIKNNKNEKILVTEKFNNN